MAGSAVEADGAGGLFFFAADADDDGRGTEDAESGSSIGEYFGGSSRVHCPFLPDAQTARLSPTDDDDDEEEV